MRRLLRRLFRRGELVATVVVMRNPATGERRTILIPRGKD